MTFWENDDAFTAKSVNTAQLQNGVFLQMKTDTCLFLFINYKSYYFSFPLNNFVFIYFL